jgi:hypothetical protein
MERCYTNTWLAYGCMRRMKRAVCQLFRTPYNSDETAGLLRCDRVLYLAEIPSRITMTMPMIGIWA